MDYTPRYAQPFTLKQAQLLDVPVIYEEIARLQNSLQHLKSTQDELQAFLRESGQDPDIAQALEENRTVIGSQEERISILNMALTHKGIYTGSGSHYALPANPPPHVEPAPTSAPTAPNRRPESSSFTQQSNGVDDNDIDDGGIFL